MQQFFKNFHRKSKQYFLFLIVSANTVCKRKYKHAVIIDERIYEAGARRKTKSTFHDRRTAYCAQESLTVLQLQDPSPRPLHRNLVLEEARYEEIWSTWRRVRKLRQVCKFNRLRRWHVVNTELLCPAVFYAFSLFLSCCSSYVQAVPSIYG